jgi:hypothetical protein
MLIRAIKFLETCGGAPSADARIPEFYLKGGSVALHT